MHEPSQLSNYTAPTRPVDWAERQRALDPTRSFLVQAPAGSGKTYLLTQRFLRLLCEAQRPEEIVAITFTNAAAAEMRIRILEALEKADSSVPEGGAEFEPESLEALAAKALQRDKLLDWKILDQPNQLRVMTIDSFCRSLALQSPLSWGLLSGLGGKLDPVNQPEELYRRAATRTLDLLRAEETPTRIAVEELLRWRDNNWQDLEDLIVQMLKVRNRWYQEFVFASASDWEPLRKRLEAPFHRAALRKVGRLIAKLDGVPGSQEDALRLARLACEVPGAESPISLAERAELPLVTNLVSGQSDLLQDAVDAYVCLARFLLTKDKEWRRKSGLKAAQGFPATVAGRAAKDRFEKFVNGLAEEPGLLAALAVFLEPMPLGYSEVEWQQIRNCFTVLRHAFGQLQVVFAESGSVDFTEVSQIALRILAPENGYPSDFALRQAESIRHLLIDEFQDTSRNQHELLKRLIAAWPERDGRSCFCVGDPMQSIYAFREAEVELFERLKTSGLEIFHGSDSAPFLFEFVSLRSNFRTVPSLVNDLNEHFEPIFGVQHGSGVSFAKSEAARRSQSSAKAELHLAFARSKRRTDNDPHEYPTPEDAQVTQLAEVVALIQEKLAKAQATREVASLVAGAKHDKYRIAVLGRTKNSVIRIAEALREAAIPFRAIDLVKLRERPEVLDALALARALANPVDRTAWLGVLRAPWCGLTLAELHLLTSADDEKIAATPVPILLEQRLPELFMQGLMDARAFAAASRVAQATQDAIEGRTSLPTLTLGSWLESVWKALGGSDTVNAEAWENLRLLWRALDKLPEGSLDLNGPGLNAALEELYALPDPEASADFGVQLMTIHKSKGLEFEVVLLPDLEASHKNSEPIMVSWLERGLSESDPASDQSELTEFLIAPIQPKGADRGNAQAWVDRVRMERETQELRRLLYVAATRAREELHLFAKPRFSIPGKTNEPTLAKAKGLLAAAWPAIEEKVEQRFAAWLGEDEAMREKKDSSVLESIAASVSSNLVMMPLQEQPEIRPTLMRRPPEGYVPSKSTLLFGLGGQGIATEYPEGGESLDQRAPFLRSHGGLESRLLGTAIHTQLEQLARLRETLEPAEAALALESTLARSSALIRGHGLSRTTAERLAKEALAVARRVATHPTGVWIFGPHTNSDTESRWTGLLAGKDGRERPWNLRPDRVFFAPGMTHSGIDKPVWWIIDYKSSFLSSGALSDDGERQAFLDDHRLKFQGQLQAYAKVLRGLQDGRNGDSTEIFAGIFYPRALILDHWKC